MESGSVGSRLGNLTKHQHFVPRFYLEQWAVGGAVHAYDLKKPRSFPIGTAGIMGETWLYEDDKLTRNNRLEKILADKEGAWAAVTRKVASLECIKRPALFGSDGITRQFSESLSSQDRFSLIEFMTYQYLRVPSALKRKLSEIGGAVDDVSLSFFLESGVRYVGPFTQRMVPTFLVFSSDVLLTSDWPAFDMKDSDLAPVMGQELGQSDGVIAAFPLSPRVCMMLAPRGFVTLGGAMIPPIIGVHAPLAEARNQNKLTIQQARRFVIARLPGEQFIFDVASRRKGHGPEQS